MWSPSDLPLSYPHGHLLLINKCAIQRYCKHLLYMHRRLSERVCVSVCRVPSKDRKENRVPWTWWALTWALWRSSLCISLWSHLSSPSTQHKFTSPPHPDPSPPPSPPRASSIQQLGVLDLCPREVDLFPTLTVNTGFGFHDVTIRPQRSWNRLAVRGEKGHTDRQLLHRAP